MLNWFIHIINNLLIPFCYNYQQIDNVVLYYVHLLLLYNYKHYPCISLHIIISTHSLPLYQNLYQHPYHPLYLYDIKYFIVFLYRQCNKSLYSLLQVNDVAIIPYYH